MMSALAADINLAYHADTSCLGYGRHPYQAANCVIQDVNQKSILAEFFNGYCLIQSQALWPFTHVLFMLFARSIANVKGAVNKKCNLLGRTVDNEHYCL
ncbi:hypothetical protein MIR68_006973 [Amoeboaphelidium protococcarum]|nr:hypothetical protein MIR68_006973 [Amoeboaphelidium protococcarum]